MGANQSQVVAQIRSIATDYQNWYKRNASRLKYDPNTISTKSPYFKALVAIKLIENNTSTGLDLLSAFALLNATTPLDDVLIYGLEKLNEFVSDRVAEELVARELRSQGFNITRSLIDLTPLYEADIAAGKWTFNSGVGETLATQKADIDRMKADIEVALKDYAAQGFYIPETGTDTAGKKNLFQFLENLINTQKSRSRTQSGFSLADIQNPYEIRRLEVLLENAKKIQDAYKKWKSLEATYTSTVATESANRQSDQVIEDPYATIPQDDTYHEVQPVRDLFSLFYNDFLAEAANFGIDAQLWARFRMWQLKNDTIPDLLNSYAYENTTNMSSAVLQGLLNGLIPNFGNLVVGNNGSLPTDQMRMIEAITVLYTTGRHRFDIPPNVDAYFQSALLWYLRNSPQSLQNGLAAVTELAEQNRSEVRQAQQDYQDAQATEMTDEEWNNGGRERVLENMRLDAQYTADIERITTDPLYIQFKNSGQEIETLGQFWHPASSNYTPEQILQLRTMVDRLRNLENARNQHRQAHQKEWERNRKKGRDWSTWESSVLPRVQNNLNTDKQLTEQIKAIENNSLYRQFLTNGGDLAQLNFWHPDSANYTDAQMTQIRTMHAQVTALKQQQAQHRQQNQAEWEANSPDDPDYLAWKADQVDEKVGSASDSLYNQMFPDQDQHYNPTDRTPATTTGGRWTAGGASTVN